MKKKDGQDEKKLWIFLIVFGLISICLSSIGILRAVELQAQIDMLDSIIIPSMDAYIERSKASTRKVEERESSERAEWQLRELQQARLELDQRLQEMRQLSRNSASR